MLLDMLKLEYTQLMRLVKLAAENPVGRRRRLIQRFITVCWFGALALLAVQDPLPPRLLARSVRVSEVNWSLLTRSWWVAVETLGLLVGIVFGHVLSQEEVSGSRGIGFRILIAVSAGVVTSLILGSGIGCVATWYLVMGSARFLELSDWYNILLCIAFLVLCSTAGGGVGQVLARRDAR